LANLQQSADNSETNLASLGDQLKMQEYEAEISKLKTVLDEKNKIDQKFARRFEDIEVILVTMEERVHTCAHTHTHERDSQSV